MPRAAFLSTSHSGTGMGSGWGSAMLSKDVLYPIGVVVVSSCIVGSAVGYAVYFIDQREITHIQKRADMKIARIEGQIKYLEDRLKAEVGRNK